MQSRQQRIRRRRDSAREWIRSGARVTVHGYAKRFGVDRYTAYDDLTTLGLTLPASARRWAQRPSSSPRHVASGGDGLVDNSWIMLNGRQFFVAGFTSGGMPYGIFEDEIDQMQSGDLDEDEPLYDSVEDKRSVGDFSAVNDDCPF
jgi:hypothetical protein